MVRTHGTAPPGRRDCYWEQLDETVVTDCTRTCWPEPDIDDEVPLEEVPEVPEVPELDDESLLAIVPVISTFSPTCLLSSLS